MEETKYVIMFKDGDLNITKIIKESEVSAFINVILNKDSIQLYRLAWTPYKQFMS